MKTTTENWTFDTPLYDLPDREIGRCDGEIYEAVKSAGYDIGTRQLINQWNCWGDTVGAFLQQLSAAAEAGR